MKFTKPHSPAEQLELARRARAGDRAALTAIVTSQNGLVRQTALSFGRHSPHVELDDLIQEGYLAVLDAVRWFDPERGFHFSTYAGDCIRRRLHRWLLKRRVAPIGPQESLPNPTGENPLELIAAPQSASCEERVREMLSQLPPLARIIVRKRHGLDGPNVSVRSFAKTLGLSRRQERACYCRAFRALRQAFLNGTIG